LECKPESKEVKMSDMKGKVCMVTGANSGIGKKTALGLAKMGTHLVMVCRSKELGEATRAEIKNESGNDSVDLLIADLSSQREIHRLASEFKDRYNRLDVLINNAGVTFTKKVESPDGIEMTFAVNHFAPFLLTHLLLDILKASVPSRVVNVSSFVHRWTNKINFDDLAREQGFPTFIVYSESKLAILMFSYELARRLAGTGITVNALNPGMVSTNLGRHFTGPITIGTWVLKNIFSIPPHKGALTSIYLASSPEVEGVTGKYFFKRKPKASSKASYNEEDWQRLWRISEELTGLGNQVLPKQRAG
jgi:NAD(P)-dependent dehydrogenase (short-subunit alcohol dehydrogenase family)